MAVTQVGEGEQGLSARAQAPPSGAVSAPMFPQAGGEEAEGGAGHVDGGRVDKHAKPLVETVFLVENPSTRGFIRLSGQLPTPHRRLEKGSLRSNVVIDCDALPPQALALPADAAAARCQAYRAPPSA